jgi:hypothetical protein
MYNLLFRSFQVAATILLSTARLLKKPGNGPNVIPDESAYGGRDPVSSNLLFFLDSPPQADFAPSGMTDLVSYSKYLVFQQPASD